MSDISLGERMRRGDVLAPHCPSRVVLRQVPRTLGGLVLLALRDGMLRFTQLRRRVGDVSDRMLAQTLKQLEAHNLVERRSFPVVPPHVEYRLTPLGEDAANRIAQLTDWIEHRLPDFGAAAA